LPVDQDKRKKKKEKTTALSYDQINVRRDIPTKQNKKMEVLPFPSGKKS